MKKTIQWGLAALFLALTVWTVAPTIAQNVACYMDQGGAGWHLGSGCTQTVESGGVLNVASGGALKIAGTDRTTALTTAPAAVAAGYKIARGATALDGMNPTTVATTLTTIISCVATINATAAPGLSTSTITTEFGTAGTMNVYGWKPTGAADTTLIASTGTDTIAWICVGT